MLSQISPNLAVVLISCRLSVEDVANHPVFRYVRYACIHDQLSDLCVLYLRECDQTYTTICTTHVHHLRNIRVLISYILPDKHLLFVDDDDQFVQAPLARIPQAAFRYDVVLLPRPSQIHLMTNVAEFFRVCPANWRRCVRATALQRCGYDKGGQRRRGEDYRLAQDLLRQRLTYCYVMLPEPHYVYRPSTDCRCGVVTDRERLDAVERVSAYAIT
jgi:hypothetical protein